MQDSNETGFTFIWRIENFRYCVETKGECLESPQFTICRGKKKTKETHLTLMLYPKGDTDESHIACYLRRESDNIGPYKIPLLFEISLKTQSGYLCPTSPQRRYFLQGQKHGTSNFIKRDEIFGAGKAFEYLNDDVLTIRCYIYEICNTFSPVGLWKAFTRISAVRNFFTWPIEEFSGLQLEKKRFKNVAIPSFPNKRFVTMALCLIGESTDKSRIKLEITLEPASHPIYVFLKMYVRDVNLKPKFIEEDEHWFREDENVRIGLWRFPFSIERKKLVEREKEYLPDNVLSLGFEFTFSFGVDVFKIEMISDGLFETQKLIACEGSETVADFADRPIIFKDNKFSDAFLRVDDEDIPIYKVAMCSQSPIFRAMFDNDMQEQNTNVVHIIDFNKDVVKRFVDFVHSLPKLQDLTDQNWNTVLELYRIGDKYQVNALTKCCTSYFGLNVSEDNIFSLLDVAVLSFDSELKQIVESYLSIQDRTFFESQDWVDFKKENVHFAAEILNFLLVKTKE